MRSTGRRRSGRRLWARSPEPWSRAPRAAALVLGGFGRGHGEGPARWLALPYSRRDPAVAAALRRTAPYLGAALMVHGLSSATEGTMLANRDAGVLGGLYAFESEAVVVVSSPC